jgi:hypothetical protein
VGCAADCTPGHGGCNDFFASINSQLNNHLRIYAGYTFLYWSDVARPGDQIDRGINTSQLPIVGASAGSAGSNRPTFSFKETDFWAQGVNAGLEFPF